jgi:two-component system chemotaxis response regulator CheY
MTKKILKMLIAEDEFLSRKLVGHYLEKYGKSDIAVNGQEAMVAIQTSYNEGNPYDVVFLDIMMPEKDGLTVLKELREFEAGLKINPSDGIKVIMTTALGDAKSVMQAFRSQCEAYITKPYTEDAFTVQLKKLGLIE